MYLKLVVVNTHTDLWPTFVIHCSARTRTILRTIWHPRTLSRSVADLSLSQTLCWPKSWSKELFKSERTLDVIIIWTERWGGKHFGRVAEKFPEVRFRVVRQIVNGLRWWVSSLHVLRKLENLVAVDKQKLYWCQSLNTKKSNIFKHHHTLCSWMLHVTK